MNKSSCHKYRVQIQCNCTIQPGGGGSKLLKCLLTNAAFFSNSSIPLLTSQSLWSTDCSPSNSSVQHLSKEKTFARPPTAGAFRRSAGLGKSTVSPGTFVVLHHVCWDIGNTQSQSGMETGAPQQRIEGLDVRVARRARVNVACTRVTGRLSYFRLRCLDFTEATYHFLIMAPGGYCCLPSICKQSKLLTGT